MAAELVGRYLVGSPEWHAARAQGLGGSEIGAVLGLSPYESAFSLWHRKAGTVTPTEDKPEMEAGRRLEPVICDKFADSHPEFLVFGAGTYRSAVRPWQIANPDRILYPCCGFEGCCDPECDTCDTTTPVALLEAKFALYGDGWGAEGTDEIPPSYLAQCRWYLDVFGLDTCYVQVFIGSTGEFREYVVRADEADALLMRERGRAFLDTIAAGTRPPIDGHTETYRTVRELHPEITPESVELPTGLVAEYLRAKADAKAAETAERAATALVADRMGSAQRATWTEPLHGHEPDDAPVVHTIARRQSKNGGRPYVVAARTLPTHPALEWITL